MQSEIIPDSWKQPLLLRWSAVSETCLKLSLGVKGSSADASADALGRKGKREACTMALLRLHGYVAAVQSCYSAANPQPQPESLVLVGAVTLFKLLKYAAHYLQRHPGTFVCDGYFQQPRLVLACRDKDLSLRCMFHSVVHQV